MNMKTARRAVGKSYREHLEEDLTKVRTLKRKPSDKPPSAAEIRAIVASLKITTKRPLTRMELFRLTTYKPGGIQPANRKLRSKKKGCTPKP